MTTELLLSFSNILAAHILSQAAVLPPTNALMGEQMAKNTNSLKWSVSAFGREMPAVIGNKFRICCKVLSKESKSSKSYKRNEAQSSNSTVFTDDIYAILYCEKV